MVVVLLPVLLTVVVVPAVTVVEFDPALGDLAGFRLGDHLVGLGESRDVEREFWQGGSGEGGLDAGSWLGEYGAVAHRVAYLGWMWVVTGPGIRWRSRAADTGGCVVQA